MNEETTEKTTTTTRKQRRPMRKRTTFKRPPRPAIPVRGLWESATEEQKQKAHTACMAILEYWLGKCSKREVAERLGVTPLRVWQLSSQALSGMLAGLLRQPRMRGKVDLSFADPRVDPKTMQRRIAELEEKLARTEDLVRVLKELPWSRPPTSAKEAKDGRGRKRGSKKRARRGPQVSRSTATTDRGQDEARGDATG